MTNEQRVRVDRLERYLITDREKTYTTVRVNDLDTVLSLIKEQEIYIKKYNDTTEEMNRDIRKLISEIQKKDKQIDLMARAIDNYDSQLEINTFKDKEHIKQYFGELAEKE